MEIRFASRGYLFSTSIATRKPNYHILAMNVRFIQSPGSRLFVEKLKGTLRRVIIILWIKYGVIGFLKNLGILISKVGKVILYREKGKKLISILKISLFSHIHIMNCRLKWVLYIYIYIYRQTSVH